MRRWRDRQVEKVLRSGAEVRLNTEVNKAVVDEVKPDVLIAAVGREPFAVPVPGKDGPNVIFGACITPETATPARPARSRTPPAMPMMPLPPSATADADNKP